MSYITRLCVLCQHKHGIGLCGTIKCMESAILQNVPVKWKLKEFLDLHGVSAYKLAEKTQGKLSRNGVYRLTSEDLAGIRFDSLEAIIPALEELTGKRVDVADLLKFEHGS